MNNFEAMAYNDRDSRDRAFEDLQKNGNELERKAIRYTDPVNENGVWKTKYFLAYPTK